MSRTWIKICGITRLEDALSAVDAGADAVGFVFAPSARRIAPDRARAIVERLPRSIRTVGVFRDAPLAEIRRSVALAGVGAIQLHGGEGPELCAAVGGPVIKRLDVRADDGPETLRRRAERFSIVEAWLLDPGAGDGRSFRFHLARGVAPRVILAGGLDPQNVARAIRAAAPWGVDVASGVETRPGIKDRGALRAFVRAVRNEDAGHDAG